MTTEPEASPPETRHKLFDASPWVRRFIALVPQNGSVLDVACGTGRHARLALKLGFDVVAVDRYNAGIVDLLGTPGFQFQEADLEDGSPPSFVDRQFAGVIVTNYLFRPLLPAIVDAVAGDGVLIYETFAQGNERFGRPSNPDYLLRPGELLEAVRGKLEIVAYEHGRIDRPAPAMIQRICAVRFAGGHSAARRLDGGA